MLRVALEGTLREIRLCDLLDVLSVTGCTGRVEVFNGKRRGDIGIHQGAVVRATLDRDQAIGEALVAAGKITRQELERALALQKRPSHSRLLLGTILANTGAITRDDLESFVRARTLEAVRTMAFWETGVFRFVPDAPTAAQGEFPDRVDAATLWAEIAGGAHAAAQLRRVLPPPEAFIEPGPPLRKNGLHVRLSRAEWAVALMVGQGRRMSDLLVEAAEFGEREALAALYSLLGSGVLVSRNRSTERLRLVESGVARVFREGGAAGVVLATLDGRRLCAYGAAEDVDADTLSSLCLGTMMCAGGLLEATGEAAERQVVIEGAQWRVLLSDIGRSALLIFLVRSPGLLGRLRLLSRDFARAYGPVLDALLGASKAESFARASIT